MVEDRFLYQCLVEVNFDLYQSSGEIGFDLYRSSVEIDFDFHELCGGCC